MKILLDTNIITYALREMEPVLSRFTETLKTDDVFVSSDVVDYEIRRYLISRKPRDSWNGMKRSRAIGLS